MKKVSVIIAAYNAHNTLARCLGSLVNQTIEDIEVIVTDDASSDDTLEIMRRCQALYPDKVIAIEGKVNRGSGGARNQALDVASGEYIGFVDSDDYVAPNMYELLYNRAIETDADIVDCGYYSQALDKAAILTNDNMTGDIDDEKRSKLIMSGGYVWSKIYKRELFEDPPVRLRENVFSMADNEVLRYMFFRGKSVYTVKQVLYYYNDTPKSATKVKDLDVYFDSVFGVMKALFDICHNHEEYKGKTKEAIEACLIVWYSYCVNTCLYEQIRKYGAGEKFISRYFDELLSDSSFVREKEKLDKTVELRRQSIEGSIRENNFLSGRISELDLKIIEECDARLC